jgi:hypothetical protein
MGQFMDDFKVEFPFILPTGYLDSNGVLHREGAMRRATAADEIQPLRDPRVQANPSYLVIILLARVLTSLGDLELINTKVIENLFVADLNYLQSFYNTINKTENPGIICPHCGKPFIAAGKELGE